MTISNQQKKIPVTNPQYLQPLLYTKATCGIILALALALPVRVAMAATVEECLDQSYDPSAAKACQQLLDNGNTSASVYLRLAQALNGQGKRAESFRIIEQGLTKNPGNSALNEMKAIVRSNLTEQEYLDAQNQKGPSARATNSAKLRILRIKCLKKQDQEALDACTEYANLGGDDAEVRARQSSLLAALAPPPKPEPKVASEPTYIDLTPSEPATDTASTTSPSSPVNPATPVQPKPTTTTTAQSEQGNRKNNERITLVKSIQSKLNNLGFAAGTPDGVSGANTRRAIADFYEATNIGSKQPINQALLNDLERAEQLQNDVIEMYRKSELALNNGDLDQATELFDTARNTANWAPSIAGLSNRLTNAIAAKRNSDEEKRKRDTIAKIQSLLRNNNLTAAAQQLDAAQQVYPADQSLQQLREQHDSAKREQQQLASEQLDNKRRKEQVDLAIATATGQFSNGNLDQALASLSEATRLAPESDRVINLRNRIQKELQRQADETKDLEAQTRKVASFVEQANQALDSGELEAARKALNNARAADPEFTTSNEMQTRIDALAKREENSAAAQQLLADAENAITNDQLDKAQTLVAQAQTLDQSLSGTDQLLAKIASRRDTLAASQNNQGDQSDQSDQSDQVSQQRLAVLLQQGKVLQQARIQKLTSQPDYFTDELPESIGKLFE